MDIQLNICNTRVNPSNKQNENILTHKKKFNGGSSFNDGEVSFKFKKNTKVKAVVARKRTNVIKPSNRNVNSENQTKKFETAQSEEDEIVQRSASPAGKFVLRRPSTSDDDGNGNQNEVSEIHSASDLMLNISREIPTDVVKLKKQNFSREEKRKNKYEKKLNKRVIDKVLTSEELKEGIKKFSEPPLATTKRKEKSRKPTVKNMKLFTDNPETKIMGQRLVKPVSEKVFTGVSMASVNLHPHCVKNLADILNITELTTVQQMTIPKALEGRDCLVRSQTGSGKTLAYALPIIQKLQEVRPKITRDCGIQAVIIVPTRELVVQTYELFLKLVKPFTWLVPGMLCGGEKRKAEKARLRKGITILVGTPGRLCDHLLHTESFKLDKVRFLVLDEADRLLELGYERDVRTIVDGINNHRAGNFTRNNPDDSLESQSNIQTDEKVESKGSEDLQRLLLSATLTSAVQKLAGLTLKNPLFIDTSDESSENIVREKNYDDAVQEAVNEGKLVIPETVQLSFIIVPPKLRLVTLSGLLAKECKNKKVKILVFMSTMEMVDFHTDLLNEALTNKVLDEEDELNEDEQDEEPLLEGLKIFKLHGSMTQKERSGVFKAFREIKAGILLATDVAGRGIDVPEVDLVIQYSPPQKIPEFVHRVGRTGRAGRNGRAILFLTPNETPFVRILEDNRIRISQGNMDTYLDHLHSFDNEANTVQEAASNLQHKLEEVLNDKEMHEKACKAFVSWVRFYSTFPKDLKHIFNAKTAHMGHFAKSFGLHEPPKSFAKNHAAPKPLPPTNRLTYSKRTTDNEKSIKKDNNNKQQKFAKSKENKLKRFLTNSISLTTSEYDSGLPELKRKRK